MGSGSRNGGLALVALLLLGAACQTADGPAIEPAPSPVVPATVGAPERSELGRFDRDGRLFSTGAPADDVQFEGRAAADLQQHTAASEGADFDPDVDLTGRRLVFASTRHSRFSRLYLKAVDGATLTQITDEAADDVQPAFSPDGTRLAFASNRSGQWDIWLVDTNGKSPTQITDNPAADLHPSWSPDGKQLVFCRLQGGEGRGELWIVDVDNPAAQRLIGEGLFPEWSPNGDKIVYQRARARGSRAFSIWTIDVRNQEALYPTEVAGSPRLALISPSWSMDGTRIVFAAMLSDQEGLLRGGRAEICVIDADGRGFQRLSSGRGENYSPTWSADGRVYFTSRVPNGEMIWSLKTSSPATLEDPLGEPVAPTGERRAAGISETVFEE